MKKILINFAHPARSHSKINNALRKAVQVLDGVTVNDLYAQYPDFMIDVQKEQTLCEEHDVIIFQHPFYWYSTPAIIKEWMDLVLEHGWAFGSQGHALKGKLFLQAISCGGEEATYKKNGYNHFTIAELTSPIQATAHLCGLVWVPPFAILGIHNGLQEQEIVQHAEDYRRTIIGLRDNNIELEKAAAHPFINSDLDSVIRRS